MSSLNKGASLQNGKYIIGATLGQGGFGITYEAEQVSLGRKVAVKEFFMKDICNRDEATSQVSVPSVGSQELVEKFRQKFIREARMIAGLDHEHIVKIYDVFEENGTAYYVMEYLGGGSLDRKIKDNGAMTESEALGYIRQIADALSYLHSQNILHFDVKPSNVLLGKNGNAKLIDFGISKHYDEAGVQTSSTPVGISKGYAPLEQYQQGSDIKSFTPATDIYSLGATLYALLTGSNPPEASVVNEDGIPAIEGISPVVMHAIEKAMQPRRKDRPQRVEEFLHLLDGSVTDDDEETFVAGAGAKTPKTKSDNEKKPAKPEKQREQQKLKETKVAAKKTLPRWLYGLFAGVVVALLAVALLSRPGKPDVPAATAQSSASSSASSTSGTHNGHEWVDLGLSVKWATMNVGASTASDYGSYFAWGETSPKSSYVWENLKYRTSGGSENVKFSKYVTESTYGTVDNKTTLELSDDAARANWGGSWRMPTISEFEELIDKCTWTWTTLNGVNGYKVVSKVNGNNIFLPAAGRRYDTSLDYAGSYGIYYSSSLNESYSYYARYIDFNYRTHYTYDHCRCYGLSVRPVLR